MFVKQLSSLGMLASLVGLSLSTSACLSGGEEKILGQDLVAGVPVPITQTPSPTDPPASGPSPLGPSCSSTDSNHLCLALKVVSYEDSAGSSVLSEAGAIQDVNSINSVWAACNIGFQIEAFSPILPSDYGLSYQPSNLAELNPIRSALQDTSTLLVVFTGTWNRSGTLGNTGANAWTNLPGGGPFGAILEQPVATYPNIIAHELGHYLNLDHASSSTNLMNPIIYSSSTQLTSSQCSAARSAALTFWGAMRR